MKYIRIELPCAQKLEWLNSRYGTMMLIQKYETTGTL